MCVGDRRGLEHRRGCIGGIRALATRGIDRHDRRLLVALRQVALRCRAMGGLVEPLRKPRDLVPGRDERRPGVRFLCAERRWEVGRSRRWLVRSILVGLGRDGMIFFCLDTGPLIAVSG